MSIVSPATNEVDEVQTKKISVYDGSRSMEGELGYMQMVR